MGTFGVQVHGGDELRRSMRKAGLDVKELTAINKSAASTVATAAKARAPMGKPLSLIHI